MAGLIDLGDIFLLGGQDNRSKGGDRSEHGSDDRRDSPRPGKRHRGSKKHRHGGCGR